MAESEHERLLLFVVHRVDLLAEVEAEGAALALDFFEQVDQLLS